MSTFSLQSLLDLAQASAGAAARTLGVSCSKEEAEQQKLQMLIDYRSDYQQNFQKSSRDGVSPASWSNFHEFMNKLDLAVKQQTEVVAHWQRSVVASREEWLAQQRRLNSYDTLSQRHHKAESAR